jgi:predicted amidohydrolase YtcJ
MWLFNAKIYTLDTQNPNATAVRIDKERIVELVFDEKTTPKIAKEQEAVDLQGKTILPGLCDAHIHLEHYALSLMKVDCEVSTKEACLRRVAARVKQSAPGEWILGHGWNQNDWESGFGNLSDLDAIAPHNPVYLTAKSLHAGWSNSAALRIANISRTTSNPKDGVIGKDDHGDPDGILYERAMDLIEACIPNPTSAEVRSAIETAQRKLWQMGITSVHDFDRRDCFIALQDIHANHQLKLRVLKSIPVENLDEAIALGLRSGFGDDFLRIGGVKVFSDGALGPHTAAMLEPYQDDAQNRGMLFMDQEALYEIAARAAAHGFPLAVHAIGDRANHEVLNAFERLAKDKAGDGDRFSANALAQRIEHVQILHPDDVPRLAQLGVSASMQPIHATSDMYMADAYWGERSALAYAFRSQIQQGARLVFGSDAPVESPNPFWGIHAAVTRRRQDGSPGDQGWYPEQRLTLEEALEAYTIGPAELAGWGDRVGRLAPGYYADMIVLDQDPFQIPPQELFQIKPLATMVGGEWVFSELES